MGLASKLQAAQAGVGMMPQPGGGAAPGGAYPSAPPAPAGYPGAPGQPGAAPGTLPYGGQQAGAPYGMPPGSAAPPGGPYGGMPPTSAPQQPYGGGASPYPQPYPGAAPGAPAGQQQPPGPGATSPYPSPYPGTAPAGTGAPGGMPQGAMQQQQQRPPYPVGMPGAGPPTSAPGMMPQQQQQQAPMMGGGAPGGMVNSILTKLNQIVSVNQLQRFYNPQSLQALATRLDSRVNFRDLAARWRMPVELALDLSSLALYDIILFADDSGSMAFEENGERIDDLKLIGNKLSEVATMFDDDGILVRFMNSTAQGNSVRSAADVGALLAGVQYSGLTPLASAMQSKVLQPIVFNLASSGQLQKPVLIMTITDGEPTDTPKDLIVQVIKDARARLAPQYGPKAVAFEFAQVGKDQRAQAFLGQLDTHPEVGSSIDCTSYFELESAEYQKRGIQLSPEMWLVKMMVGSIDPSYDEGDE